MDLSPKRIEKINWTRPKYESLYSELIARLKSEGPYILFIGAGVSKNPYPDWNRLVDIMTSEIPVMLTEDEEGSDNSVILKLGKCQQHNRTKFYEVLKDLFNPRGKIEFKPLHLDLISLPKIKGFITTNIDMSLCTANSRVTPDVKLTGCRFYPNSLPPTELKERKLFHIHGIFEANGKSMIEETIFTNEDYKRGYPNNIEPFLKDAFKFISTIFIGFSMKDPDVSRILEICKRYLDERKRESLTRPFGDEIMPQHYIFTPALFIHKEGAGKTNDTNAEDEQDDYYSRTFNLHTIRYNMTQEEEHGEHTELNKIIRNLISETRELRLGD